MGSRDLSRKGIQVADEGDNGAAPPISATAAAAHEVLKSTDGGFSFKRLSPFMGPAFVASVAYMDPGNFATNIESGSKFGYELVWVIVASNLMAMLLQTLSAKLGIAAGRNLPELCREHYPRVVVWFLWVLMEIVAMATDLAEFLGAALGFNLLFGVPLWVGAVLTAIATFVLLGLERRGFRPLEAAITALVGVVAVCYLIETILDRPEWLHVAAGLRPQFSAREAVLLASGILGATVMPHAVLLHSALTQGRIVVKTAEQKRRLFKFEVMDVTIAMGIAGMINAAMLIMAAATFHSGGACGGRFDRGCASDPGAAVGQGGQRDLCDFAAGGRPFVGRGGHHGRPGDHAGLRPSQHPAVAAAWRDDASIVCRHFHGPGPHPHAGDQPGGA